MDLTKVAKLLSLTQQDNDHEALLAVRMANALLKKHGKTWYQVLGVTPSDDEGTDITAMFTFIRNHAWQGFDFTFIDSLEAQYKKTGKLSEKQKAALIKILNSV